METIVGFAVAAAALWLFAGELGESFATQRPVPPVVWPWTRTDDYSSRESLEASRKRLGLGAQWPHLLTEDEKRDWPNWHGRGWAR